MATLAASVLSRAQPIALRENRSITTAKVDHMATAPYVRGYSPVTIAAVMSQDYLLDHYADLHLGFVFGYFHQLSVITGAAHPCQIAHPIHT